MRLWHESLIPVLPKKMLISQWRECIAIKRQWEKGTLKHRLVSYVMQYNSHYFENYVIRILDEMEKRNIKWKQEYADEIFSFCNKIILDKFNIGDKCLSYPEHNYKYLIQCVCNLEEKHDRGIISDEEWLQIHEFCKPLIKDIFKGVLYDKYKS